ncbi:trichohyalin-like [Rhopilema esculentum]|uniref:trichohyalin-like n=1 Tax=Rhopilema esculentum TaxID=499914 RepID=UPI0031E1D204
MVWSQEHDLLLLREILVSQPFKFPFGSRERGQCWSKVAKRLNDCQNQKFYVDQRAVRERFEKIERDFRRRMAQEERASGIAVEENELDQALEDIIGFTEAAEEELARKAEEKKNNREKEKETAEDVRKRSMERLSQTQVREKNESENKRKRSGENTMEFLREKALKEYEIQKEEITLRKKEMEIRIEEADNEKKREQFEREQREEERKRREKYEETIISQQHQIIYLMQKQQEQQKQILQQMQQQNTAIISILAKLAERQ